MAKRDYDESDVRIRPTRRTKPRTKDRPAHKDAVKALVTTVDRGRTTCALISGKGFAGTELGKTVMAMKARELGPKSVVVGDYVNLVGDISGREGTLARIVSIEPRKTVLVRTVDDAAQFERVIAANIDQLIIVAAAANPEPRRGLIDRFLVSAFVEKICPIILITKTDIAPVPDFISEYKDLDITVITREKGDDLKSLRKVMAGKVSVMVGHSGVGKSTLLNELTSAEREIGNVNDVTGRGRHTSSSAIAVPVLDKKGKIEPNTWLIDTPGVRAFGLSHLDPNAIVAAFSDLAEVTKSCLNNCTHNEPDCALNAWMAPASRSGEPGQEIPERVARVKSLRSLLSIDSNKY